MFARAAPRDLPLRVRVLLPGLPGATVICESAASSPARADLTTALPEPDSTMPSSASPTSGGGASCASGSPECPSTRTYGLSENQRGELLLTDTMHQLTAGGGKPGQGYPAIVTIAWSGEESHGIGFEEASPTLRGVNHGAHVPLIFSAAGSPARTCPSPETEQGSPAIAPASSSSSPESPGLFDPDGFSSRTYPVSSLARAVGTSEACLERWPTSGMAWPGGFSTAVSSECRSDAGGCSSSERSLTEILEPPQNVPARYSLSARAALGILRRAEKRGRALPSPLLVALEAVARTTTTYKEGGS